MTRADGRDPRSPAAAVPSGAFTAALDRGARRALVAAVRGLDGIDFVEVLPVRADARGDAPGTPAQRTLVVHLIHGPVPAALAGPTRVLVLGDAARAPVRVLWAHPARALAGDESLLGVPPEDRRQVAVAVSNAVADEDLHRVLVVRAAVGGGRSSYTLRLVGEDGDSTPDGFDQPLAEITVDLDADCPVVLDCRPAAEQPETAPSPVLDYLARDYDGLRTRLTDRLSALLPDWTDRSPADIGVTLIELYAYLGDRLAYRQDAVAREAHLGTARRRASVRRHARLLDYRVHEGCSARTWLAFDTPVEADLPRGSAVADTGTPVGRRPPSAAEAVAAGATVFETCAPARLLLARNRLALHAWGATGAVLPAGATSAFVSVPADSEPGLRSGDVLVLAEVGTTGLLADGDPTHRCAVRLDRAPLERVDPLADTPRVLELHWSQDDALPVPLRISSTDPGPALPTAVALANVVLADHGATLIGGPLDPPAVPATGTYRPLLRHADPAWTAPADPAAAAAPSPGWHSAADALRPDPREAVAQLRLDDGTLFWSAAPDLLGGDRRAPRFVVEPEPDGSVRLRFGDGTTGRRPAPGTEFTSRYRAGGGTAGNTGANTLDTLLLLPDGTWLDGVTVTNPLPAVGGTDPQPLSEVRELAPTAFHGQQRAVTAADHAAVAVREGDVRGAVARTRWAGSWRVQEVAVDADDPYPPGLAALLDSRRMAGVDVELVQASVVPLEIRLVACPAPGYPGPEIAGQLRAVLSADVLPDGRRGFFHPDRLGLGHPVFLSDLVGTAMSVAGTARVEVEGFGRLGAGPAETVANLAAGRIEAAARETLRCDSDPRHPEHGLVDVVVRGGL
ncbi:MULTISPECIES: hypothetical protein [unclassified Streptomyces]|uniref:hypothetical protein n=1 Tax=unclassified Streptomyces TaxID=2593676 RepID=UPI00325016C0